MVKEKIKEQKKTKKFQSLILPRIEIDNKLVIRRKSWFFPKNLLPIKKINESASSYFIRVNEWREKNSLPKEFFISLVNFEEDEIKEVDNDKLNIITNRETHKPQYISFDNPFLIEIFSLTCKKAHNTLKITEMLPNSNQIYTFGDEKRVTEFIIEWDSNNNS